MTLLTKKIPEWKQKEINDIYNKLINYKTVGLVDIKGLPAQQFHELRKKLREKMEIIVVRKVILKYAFELAKSKMPNIEQLYSKIGEMPALILSNENPFKISKAFSENMAPTFAKPGQLAPEDIEIQEGPTPFTPGPMIAELQALGLKTKVEGGKLVVIKKTTITKKGMPISQGVADLLVKLDIKPMLVGFNFTGAWEDKFIYDKDVLKFNIKDYMDNLAIAASNAFMLSLGLPYPTKENINILISKAYKEAKILGLDKNIISKEILPELMYKAQAQASALNSLVKQ